MPRVESLGKPFRRHGGRDLISRKCLFLERIYALHNLFRRTFGDLRHLMFKRTPAEHAALVTPEGRSHLDASVAYHPVKLVLVALFTAAERSLAPEAGFHRRSGPLSEKLIPLPPEQVTWSGGLRSRALPVPHGVCSA